MNLLPAPTSSALPRVSSRRPAILLAFGAALWVAFAFQFPEPTALPLLMVPIGLGIVLHRPNWGLFGMIALAPFVSSFEPGASTQLANGALPILVLAAWTLHRIGRRSTVSLPPPALTRWFGAFLLWSAVCSLTGNTPTGGLIQVFHYALLFAVLVMIYEEWSEREIGRVLLVLGVLILPVAVYATWQVATLGLQNVLVGRTAELSPQRLSSIYENPNTLGVVCATSLLILVGYGLSSTRIPLNLVRGVRASVILVFVLTIASGLVLSFSRSAILYAGTASLVLGLQHRRLRWFLTGGVLAAGLSLLLIPMPLWLFVGLRVGSGTSSRVSLWKAAWHMMSENPWTGIGPGDGAFELQRTRFIDPDTAMNLTYLRAGGAHNVFLNNGALMGWLGLALTIAFFFLLWRTVPGALRDYRRGNWVRGVAAAGIVGLTLRALFESGMTLGSARMNNTVPFFLFTAILLRQRSSFTTSPPTVAVPATRFRDGRTGGQRVIRDLIDRWKASGLSILCEDELPIPKRIRHKRGLLPFWYWAAYGNLEFGVLVADQSAHGRLALVLRRLRGRPGVRILVQVNHLREEYLFKNRLYTNLARRHETSVLRMAHRIVVHSPAVADQVAARGIPRRRITIVPYGVHRPDHPTVRRSPGAEESLRLLWVGGDFVRKGLDSLLEAIARSPKDLPPPTLTVFGAPHSPTVMEAARRTVERLGLVSLVRFVGHTPEIPESAWAEHDVYVQPSLHEGHGLALDEALIRGVPCLVSDLEVFRRRLQEGDAVFVPPGDVDAIVDRLVALRDPDLLRTLSARGITRAKSFPDRSDLHERFETIIREEILKATQALHRDRC